MSDIIKDKQDLTYLSWSKIRHSSGTAGSFLKSYSELGGKKIYYKLSNYDIMRGVVGHECVNEIIAARLLDILGIPHLPYTLIHADIFLDGNIREVYLCASEDFKKKGDSKIALDDYYAIEKLDKETPLEFCVRNGWEEYIYSMLLVDFLILNRDRHGANIEVLRNSRFKTLRLAPLFDQGLSLFCAVTPDKLSDFDVLADLPVNNFIGSRSAYENLKLIPEGKLPRINPLREEDRAELLKDLDGVISSELQDKIWEMIWKRWCVYEDFCSSR